MSFTPLQLSPITSSYVPVFASPHLNVPDVDYWRELMLAMTTTDEEGRQFAARCAIESIQNQLLGKLPASLSAAGLGTRTLKAGGLVSVATLTPPSTPEEMMEMDIEEEKMAATTLFDLLSNDIVLYTIAPLMTVSSLQRLSAVNKAFRTLVLNTPGIYRHLNLSTCAGADSKALTPIDVGGVVWRHERMDEAVTEEDFWAGPLRGIFGSLENKLVLQDVHTLVLDGSSVPPDLVAEILSSPRFNVRILSIRDCVNMNERRLMQVIQYATRPSRPEGSPKIKGIYLFGSSEKAQEQAKVTAKPATEDTHCCSNSSCTKQTPLVTKPKEPLTNTHLWYNQSDRLYRRDPSEGWSTILSSSESILSFDAILCRSPRHDSSKQTTETGFLPPAIATRSLGNTKCASCNTTAGAGAVWGSSPSHHFPLLAPPPTHSSRLVDAQKPDSELGKAPEMTAMCDSCVVDRQCRRCRRWWCHDCFPLQWVPGLRTTVNPELKRSCFECGFAVSL